MSDITGYDHRSRREHVAWAKGRALEFIVQGDLGGAFDSLQSDLNKHPETRSHAALDLGPRLRSAGLLSSAKKLRDFIEGVN